MVAWWKRLLLSLFSLIVATILCFACIVVYSVLKSHPVSFRNSEVLLTVGVTIGFCIIAWVISSPVVLLVTNIRGWRFWFYWVLGSCVGPALMVALTAAIFYFIAHAPGQPLINPAVYPLIEIAGAISCLTSAFYLLLLRRAQASIARRSGAVAI